jgi:hypothetical protein
MQKHNLNFKILKPPFKVSRQNVLSPLWCEDLARTIKAETNNYGIPNVQQMRANAQLLLCKNLAEIQLKLQTTQRPLNSKSCRNTI